MDEFVKDPIGLVTNLLESRHGSHDSEASSKITGTKPEIYFICRRGNDSLVSATALHTALVERGRDDQWTINNVAGGVRAWSTTVDERFPLY